MTSRPCTATTAAGNPCRAWAVRGSKPALCAAHGGGRWPVGPPQGNVNALRHGYYAARPAGPDRSGGELAEGDSPLPEDCTIDAVIDMLYHKQILLDDFIDQILAAGRPAPSSSPSSAATARPSPS
ncbi:MAG: hypothetical protein PVH41_09185 [Anaerolineae bacterium]